MATVNRERSGQAIEAAVWIVDREPGGNSGGQGDSFVEAGSFSVLPRRPASRALPHDPDVEVPAAERPHKPHPQREVALGRPGGRDVSHVVD